MKETQPLFARMNSEGLGEEADSIQVTINCWIKVLVVSEEL